ncbi:MAG: diacylglycerol kinase family lipid kinase [Nitrospirae bacterium]|nr:diacylglycerol kinase family lipid kinase [Nitrospirota bacterium]MCL5977899.1 diacylglycerol kinase family lipid kinase [Nitrospirota bacterium]
MKNIILIGNPIAGGGALKKIKRAVALLEGRGCNVNLMLTARKGDAEAFAREITQQSAVGGQRSELLVIAAGGDGTYNETANGLVYSDIPMAILPLGTTSVLAKELKIPDGLENALDVALNGKIQTIHLGKITCTRHSLHVSRHFILMAGIGFDGDTVYSVNEKLKKISGKGAYIFSGIKTLFKYNPSRIILKMKTPNSELIGYAAIVGKASCYGGEFKITPDASLFEPYFYVFVTHNKRRLNLLKHIAEIAAGKHPHSKDISYFKTSEIEIDGNAHIQIDGDYLGMTPAKIEIKQNALRLATRD